MLSFFALLALLPVCLVVSARHRWPRTPAKCSARICDAARSLRQRCGAVFYVGHPEGPSFLGVARAPRPRVCCIGGVRCARRSFEIIIYIENDAFWGRSGWRRSWARGCGRWTCALHSAVGRVSACLCRSGGCGMCMSSLQVAPWANASVYAFCGRSGWRRCSSRGDGRSTFFFAFLWSVVGLVVEGVGAKCKMWSFLLCWVFVRVCVCLRFAVFWLSVTDSCLPCKRTVVYHAVK